MYYAAPVGATPEEVARDIKRHNRFLLGLFIAVLCMPLVLCCVLHGQNLPDAPSATRRVPYAALRSPQLGWGETFKSKKFVIPTAVMFAAVIFDAETTHAGVGRHRCVESNTDLPWHPSRGELYRNMLITRIPIATMGYFFTKSKFPWPIYAGMAGYGTAVNIKGAASWYANCW